MAVPKPGSMDAVTALGIPKPLTPDRRASRQFRQTEAAGGYPIYKVNTGRPRIRLRSKSAGIEKLKDGGGYYDSEEWARLKRQCKVRDGWACTACGFRPSKTDRYRLEAHHVVSRNKGGRDVLSNLRTLCDDCHKGVHNHLVKRRKSPI